MRQGLVRPEFRIDAVRQEDQPGPDVGLASRDVVDQLAGRRLAVLAPGGFDRGGQQLPQHLIVALRVLVEEREVIAHAEPRLDGNDRADHEQEREREALDELHRLDSGRERRRRPGSRPRDRRRRVAAAIEPRPGSAPATLRGAPGPFAFRSRGETPRAANRSARGLAVDRSETSFVAQRLDRIQTSGAARRVVAEDETHDRRDQEGAQHQAGLELERDVQRVYADERQPRGRRRCRRRLPATPAPPPR